MSELIKKTANFGFIPWSADRSCAKCGKEEGTTFWTEGKPYCSRCAPPHIVRIPTK